MKSNKKIYLFAWAIVLLTSCGSQSANAGNDPAQTDQPATTAPTETAAAAAATIDGISQFVGWDLGAMSVTKEGDRFVLSDAADNLKLYLKPTGDGTYQETTTSTHMIGQGARFVAEKVGDVTTLTAYDGKMMLFTLVNCDDLIAYRNKAYRRILTSRFEPTADGLITITDDKMCGPILPDSPDISYFFVEDGKGDLTDKIRLSPGRYHLYFSPADKGLNLHFCSIDPETGEFDVSYDTENSLILRYAKDPGWSWLSTDVLDAGFLIYNFDKPYWQLMLNKLKAKKQPNEVERWNRKLIENLLKYNEPYSALESSARESTDI